VSSSDVPSCVWLTADNAHDVALYVRRRLIGKRLYFRDRGVRGLERQFVSAKIVFGELAIEHIANGRIDTFCIPLGSDEAPTILRFFPGCISLRMMVKGKEERYAIEPVRSLVAVR
jgi:hypothetical protein